MSSLILSYEDIDLYDRDIILFKNHYWLNDSCISYCYKRIYNTYDNPEHILLIDPSIVSFLKLQCENEEEYDQLAINLNIRNKVWVFLPINDNKSFLSSSTHWSLLLIHIPSNSYLYLDSNNQYNYEAAIETSKKISLLLKRNNLLEINKILCPQQQNSYDCGIYIVIFTKYICELIITYNYNNLNEPIQKYINNEDINKHSNIIINNSNKDNNILLDNNAKLISNNLLSISPLDVTSYREYWINDIKHISKLIGIK